MKKLLIFLSFVSVLNIQTYSDCSYDEGFDQAPTVEQQETARRVINALFSRDSLKRCATYAQQSQAPLKDFFKSTIAAMNLNKEQLESIKKYTAFCVEQFPKAITLVLQAYMIRMPFIQEHFALELEQKKCSLDAFGNLVIAYGLSNEEVRALQNKESEVSHAFRAEFEQSLIGGELKAIAEQAQKLSGTDDGLAKAFYNELVSKALSAFFCDREQLILLGMSVLSDVTKYSAETIQQAVDEQLQTIQA